MRVLYVLRGTLGDYPPCVAQVLMLDDLGVQVEVYCGACVGASAELLRARDITVHELGTRRRLRGPLGKLEAFLRFRRSAIRILRDDLRGCALLWFGTADSGMALLGRLRSVQFVLSVLELYDTNPVYSTMLRIIAPRAAAVIACEVHRAWIMSKWWRLPRLPYVLPNKTYGHPRAKGLTPSTRETAAAIQMIGGRQAVIYQGMIAPDRDLTQFARALAALDSDYLLVLMGPESYDGVARIRSVYPNTVYVGRLDAPTHLEVTSHARLGVAHYDGSTLNNIFCAPNKTFEYAGFGIPILCSDVPGLVHTVGESGAGICVDFGDHKALCDAIRSIDLSYDSYAEGAERLFCGVDNLQTMKSVLAQLREIGA